MEVAGVDVAVVEDNLIVRKELVRLLASYPDINVVGSFDQGEELLKVMERFQLDILFLDICLPGLSGVQVAEILRKQFPYLEIVFINGDDISIRDAFRLYASDYISKPFNPERICRTISRIKNRVPAPEPKIELKSTQGIKVLVQNEIYLVQSAAKKCVVYTAYEAHTCLHSLKEMEQYLNSQIFFRTSRSDIVNLKLVKSIEIATRHLYKISFNSRDYHAFLQKEILPEFRQRIKELNVCTT